ncbi:MAG TPA: hypothetical protein VEJ16_13920 [Alphaproteobacteria bacterium]|nr:hypothetical protein [Alphaproteobacteria bacterium]
MLATFGAVGIILGTLAAAGARLVPARKARLERSAGLLIVAGVVFLGLAFPMV